MIADISRQDLKDWMDRGADFVLVEALPREQYEHAHLPGAINIPADEVAMLAPRLIPDKESRVVVYCAHSRCDASKRAASDLSEMGYRQVLVYEQGKKDWVAAGLPIEGKYATEGESPEVAA